MLYFQYVKGIKICYRPTISV